MTKKELTRRMEQADRLVKLGLTYDEAETIRRISMTLHRWSEHECNGNIQRDEVTGVPRWFSDYEMQRAKSPKGTVIPDRESGAIRRMWRIIKAHPGLAWYHQTDPRGAQVYVYSVDKLEGRSIDSVYNSIGVAIY